MALRIDASVYNDDGDLDSNNFKPVESQFIKMIYIKLSRVWRFDDFVEFGDYIQTVYLQVKSVQRNSCFGRKFLAT